MQTWSAPYDRTTKLISTLVCLLLLGVVAATRSLPVGILIAVTVLLAFAYSPRRYVLTGENLRVKRLLYDAVIPTQDLIEARPATPSDLSGAIRLWGSGGLFGYYGLFSTSKLGTCTWYVTNRSQVMLLITSQKAYALSPDNAETFLAALGPLAKSGATRSGLAAPARTPFWRARAFALSLVALALVVVGLALSYSPGPPVYTLTADSLRIQDRFYPVTLQPAEVDLDKARIVDLDPPSEWRPTLRTNGFSNARYHSGWYRVAGGQTVRLYRADAKRLVLLPPKAGGSPVLLEVRDPEAFLERLRREWTRSPS